jgi:hypothetical protein
LRIIEPTAGGWPLSRYWALLEENWVNRAAFSLICSL